MKARGHPAAGGDALLIPPTMGCFLQHCCGMQEQLPPQGASFAQSLLGKFHLPSAVNKNKNVFTTSSAETQKVSSLCLYSAQLTGS